MSMGCASVEKLLKIGHERNLEFFLAQWGEDREVLYVTTMLFLRWKRQLTAADYARVSDARALLGAAAAYIDFHGPHLWAGLLTEQGIRASVRDRRAAQGSF